MMKTVKVHELLISKKRSICRFKKDNPSATLIEIARHFGELWNCEMSLSSIKEVLKRKDYWLSLKGRTRSNKIREIESALFVGLCDIASSTTQPVTGSMIRGNSKIYAEELLTKNVKFASSNGWFDRFKRRYGINLLTSSRHKSDYGFQNVHRSRKALMELICQTDLENVYVLVPVQLCHLYNPQNSNHNQVEDSLFVFLCVNVTGTDMMTPLVFGSNENSEDFDRVQYIQETEPTWGFVHWLLAAEKHINRSAKIIARPDKFIACLPCNNLQVQLHKTNPESYKSIKHVFDKITLLFKASFRRFQLQDKCQTEGSYLTHCLRWIRDAWWGLPGGALHGHWHQISEIIKSGHSCSLPPDTSKLCSAIEDIAMNHLNSCLTETTVDAKEVLNMEDFLPKFQRLTINEIVNIMLLYEQLAGTDDTAMEYCSESNNHENNTSTQTLKNHVDSSSLNGHTKTEKKADDHFTTSSYNHNGDASTSSDTKNKVVLVNGIGKSADVKKSLKRKRSEEREEEPTQDCIVTRSQALAAIQTVISYLHKDTSKQKLYNHALKIWYYLDAQR